MKREKSSAEKKIEKKSRQLLKEAMASIDFTKHVLPVVDEEDGETYYTVEPKSGLKISDINIVDAALVECAKLYSTAGIPNQSRFYKKISRMVHYALYEIESREMLKNEVSKYRKEANDGSY